MKNTLEDIIKILKGDYMSVTITPFTQYDYGQSANLRQVYSKYPSIQADFAAGSGEGGCSGITSEVCLNTWIFRIYLT